MKASKELGHWDEHFQKEHQSTCPCKRSYVSEVSISGTLRNPKILSGQSEHFSFEQHFSMAAMIVLTQKCHSEDDISRLEQTDSLQYFVIIASPTCFIFIEKKCFIVYLQ